jgi:NAD(P) transhydrogenase
MGVAMHYDLVVIGSDPAGREGAVAAAKLNKRVAVIERIDGKNGGIGLNTGTLPNETLHAAIRHLIESSQRDVSRDQSRSQSPISMRDLRAQLSQVCERERNAVRNRLASNGIDFYQGEARFGGPHEVDVLQWDGKIQLTADRFLMACGTQPSRPRHIPFDGQQIFDSTDVLTLERLPKSMIVVGGSAIGIEYATLFATLGVEVTVVDGHERLFDFRDRQCVDALADRVCRPGMTFRLGEEVIGINRPNDGTVVVQLECGERLVGETVLYSAGRVGDTEDLNLAVAGLESDESGRLWCNEHGQTWAEHIYGVGGVVGFPAPTGTAKEQGCRAVCRAFEQPAAGFSLDESRFGQLEAVCAV